MKKIGLILFIVICLFILGYIYYLPTYRYNCVNEDPVKVKAVVVLVEPSKRGEGFMQYKFYADDKEYVKGKFYTLKNYDVVLNDTISILYQKSDPSNSYPLLVKDDEKDSTFLKMIEGSKQWEE